MAFFLDSLEPYKEKAIELFKSGHRPNAIFFSKSTYQFFFKSEYATTAQQGESLAEIEGSWVFLQSTEDGSITDCFCSCCRTDQEASSSDLSDSNGCIHMALSWITLFSKGQDEVGGETTPLHTRFYRASPLHHFLYSYFIEKRDDYTLQIGELNSFSLRSKESLICTLTSEKKEILSSISALYAQLDEVDETSIHFSALSVIEIEDWKRGAPSDLLSYELSPISYMAKMAFLYMEGALSSSSDEIPHLDCLIDFEKKHAQISLSIPSILEISFFEAPFESIGHFFLSLLKSPALVTSNLTIDVLRKRHYSLRLDNGVPEITSVFSGPEKAPPGLFPLTKNWLYEEVNQKIFFCGAEDPFVTSKDSIEESFRVLEAVGAITPQKMALSQSIKICIDTQSIKTISTLIGKNKRIDVTAERALFGEWMIIPRSKNAALCEPRRLDAFQWIKIVGIKVFSVLQMQISLSHIDLFLMQHRMWLSNQRGFQLHFYPYKKNVSFEIDRKNRSLLFISRPKESVQSSQMVGKEGYCSFGKWVWRRNEGFFLSDEIALVNPYSKTALSSIPFNIPIPPHRVAHLLRNEHDAITQFIPNFFSYIHPVQILGLKIGYNKKEAKVEIALQHSWLKEKYEKEVYLYDDYGYIPEIGFFHIPTLDIDGLSVLEEDKDTWEQFFLIQLPNIKSKYECEIDPYLIVPETLQLYCNRLDPIICESLPTDNSAEMPLPSHQWQSEFFWKSSIGTVALQDIIVGLEKGLRFFPTEAGLIDLTDERFLWAHSFIENKVQKKGKPKKNSRAVELRSYDFMRIQAHEELYFTHELGAHEQIIRKLLNTEAPSEPILTYFSGSLRAYQKSGLSWLWFLYTSSLSGLLCDDMGVGKTHQAMALLAAVYAEKRSKERNKKKSCPRFLIICPASLIWHWKDKLSLFLPELSSYLHIGASRSIQDLSKEWDILITTYGTLRKDISYISTLHFEVAVFDELQIAKNHMSLIWRSLSKIRTTMRIGLSGTPIENQLRELKALFDLVLPGYLPPDPLFRELYLQSNDAISLEKRKALLAQSVKPFVLRRKKEQVLPELPSKVEETVHAELIGAQKTLYEEIASLEGMPLIQQLQDASQSIPYMHIFALLSALKQISNHPASYLKDPIHYKKYESGKWQLFQELIEEAIGSGQKVVVFSQYLIMLDIMALYCQEMNIGYAEIRGKTKARGDQIEKFQNDPKCAIFLGSLQTSGLGIDLTAASIVIHYDRWWNAARENQATDRVHRSGQLQSVQVMKLVTKETVDESIDRMIMRKSSLLQEIVNYDDHEAVKGLSRDELIELLYSHK
ncbi:MAG: DEAD/DEAH box helicase [Chlamydia sp.]